ncbi:hypothetical protein [Photobacterium indicum]|uniref:Uncharacterized protein n=1 Tax=Photobacterium indicum TaxID=81447 RepID=A0A2T3LAV3_9GAMM|nr:hypothetical protein [Photobacterium indicum]PSV48465.1 hypothetical protein C9J47_08095 [Photobacterium indicum]
MQISLFWQDNVYDGISFNAMKQAEILRQQSWQSNEEMANMVIIFLNAPRGCKIVLESVNRIVF